MLEKKQKANACASTIQIPDNEQPFSSPDNSAVKLLAGRKAFGIQQGDKEEKKESIGKGGFVFDILQECLVGIMEEEDEGVLVLLRSAISLWRQTVEFASIMPRGTHR